MKLEIVESLGMDIIHAFFAILDSVIYGLIAQCYEFIDVITDIKLNGGVIDEIASRIYAILGIFMLFKVSWSFVNYIVNPDTMTDKEKGVQNVIKNIVIMFVMLLICPWVFEQLYGIQKALLDDDVVGNLLFGRTSADTRNFQMSYDCDNYIEIDMNSQNGKGNFLALTLFKPFYQLSTGGIDAMSSEAGRLYCNPTPDSNGSINVSSYLKATIYNDAPAIGSDTYKVSYLFGISTVVGVVALLFILSMLLDISLRAVKLMFYQLIAPIPIISYVDPNSGKNGMFIKWIKAVGSTWASLFVRLFAFNFAIYMIQLFTDASGSMFYSETEPGVFANVLLILGALMFAKQLPKLIQDITGFKMDGSFNINPLKKLENEAIGGKAIAGAASGLARGAAGLAIGGAMGAMAGQGAGHAAVSALKSGAAGLKNTKLGNIRENQADYNRKMRMANMKGSTLGGRFRAGVSEYFGTAGDMGNIMAQEHALDEEMRTIDEGYIRPIDNDINRRKENIRRLQNSISDDKNKIADQQKIIDAGKAYLDTSADRIRNNKAGRYSQNYNDERLRIEQMKTDFYNNPNTSRYTAAEINNAEKALNDNLKTWAQQYADDVAARRESDAVLASKRDSYVSTANTYGASYGEVGEVYASNVQAQIDRLTSSTNTISNSIMGVEQDIERENRSIAQSEQVKAEWADRKAGRQQRKDNLRHDKEVAQANADMPMRPPHMGPGPGGGGKR